MNSDASQLWGLPNWMEPDSYGGTSCWCKYRWRWEFFRRREDLRADFDEFSDQTYRVWYDIFMYEGGEEKAQRTVKPDHPRFRANAPGCLEKYGYFGIPNPRLSELESYYPSHERSIAFIAGKGDRIWGEPQKVGAGDGEILVRFDLDQPLPAQIEIAQTELRAYQEIRHGGLLRSNRHPRLWPTYLRVLDGRECGASWRQIFEVALIDQKGAGNKNPDQEARNVWEAARKIMFNWPV